MIIDTECSFCYGCGRIHSDGHTGDPMDRGADCPVCGGTGVVEFDAQEEAEDSQ